MSHRILLLLLLLMSTGASAGAEPLTLGVHPYLPATELVHRFTPLARHLEKALGRPVEVTISASYAAHSERVATGELDIAFLGPAPYAALTQGPDDPPLPILAALEIEGRTLFHGVIITRDDSPLNSPEDLVGRQFAFVDPNSTMGYVVPLSVLERHGVALESLGGHGFLGSHDNVALGVLLGRHDAGAVKSETFEKYRGRGLRALAVTPDIPEHLFVAGDHVVPAQVETLRTALLALPRAPGGEAILRAINPDLTGLAPIRDSDYDDLRRMLGAGGVE